MTKRSLALIVFASASLGVLAGASLERRRREANQQLATGLRAVEVAGLCANALRASQAAKPETERKLLETRMPAALAEADESLAGVREIPLAIPNLIEGVNRARQYAVSNDMRSVIEMCDRVLATLRRTTEGG